MFACSNTRCKLKLWRQDISRASRFPIVLFWPRKTIVHNMSLLTWLNISQAKLLYEILQIRFNGRRFAGFFFRGWATLQQRQSRGFIIAPTFRQGKSLSNKINTHTVNCSQLPFLKGGKRNVNNEIHPQFRISYWEKCPKRFFYLSVCCLIPFASLASFIWMVPLRYEVGAPALKDN